MEGSRPETLRLDPTCARSASGVPSACSPDPGVYHSHTSQIPCRLRPGIPISLKYWRIDWADTNPHGQLPPRPGFRTQNVTISNRSHIGDELCTRQNTERSTRHQCHLWCRVVRTTKYGAYNSSPMLRKTFQLLNFNSGTLTFLSCPWAAGRARIDETMHLEFDRGHVRL